MAALYECGNTICISDMTRREMEVIKKAYKYFSNLPPEPGHPPFTVNIESTFTPSTTVSDYFRELMATMCTEEYPSDTSYNNVLDDFRSRRRLML